MEMPDQKGGPPGAQYVGASSGGLFIPPMTRVPHIDEQGMNQSQAPRQRNRSLAIPIVPPKVHVPAIVFCVCSLAYWSMSPLSLSLILSHVI